MSQDVRDVGLWLERHQFELPDRWGENNSVPKQSVIILRASVWHVFFIGTITAWFILKTVQILQIQPSNWGLEKAWNFENETAEEIGIKKKSNFLSHCF